MHPDGRHPEFVDPDVDLHDPAQRAETRPREWDLLLAIAAGGVLGAEARYALGRLIPHRTAEFPWATLLINVAGCLLIGVLMVVVLDVLSEGPRLLRPFLGVGVLGGFTTFSTFAVDTERLLAGGRWGTAGGYVLATLLLGQFAVQLGTSVTRRLARAAVPEVSG